MVFSKQYCKYLWCILFVSAWLKEVKSQTPIEIPNVYNHVLVTSGTNGGPTLMQGDNFGRSVADVGDVNKDGIRDIAVGAYLEGTSDTGAVWVCFMNTDGTVKSTPAPKKIKSGLGLIGSDFFGYSVVGIGDLNGDGNPDMAVGSPGTDRQSTSSCGSVYILFLDSLANVTDTTEITNNKNGFPSGGLPSAALLGSSLANVGDINGDGTNDIAVGESGISSNTGGVWVILLNTDGTVRAYTEVKNGSGGLGSAILDASDKFGISIGSAGDLDNDGYLDIVVGANGDDDAYANAGAFYSLYLDSLGAVHDYRKILPKTDNNYYPNNSTVGFGESVCLTDINEDGISDLVAGIRAYNRSKGGFYFMTLDSAQNVRAIKMLGYLQGWSYAGPTVAPQLGVSFCETLLDSTHARKQYIIGANFHSATGTQQGSFYTITMDSLTFDYSNGTVSDFVKIGDFSGSFSATLTASDLFGTSVAGIGDLDGNGYPDVAVGAIQNDDSLSNSGAVYILLLDSLQNVSSYYKIRDTSANFKGQLHASDLFGSGVCPAGDFDGDGVQDIFAGAQHNTGNTTNDGAVYLIKLNNDGTVKGNVKIAYNSTTLPLRNGDNFGVDVDTIGDVNGDGVVDLVVGAYKNDDGGTDKGAVWIVMLHSDGTVRKSQCISDTAGGFTASFSGTSVNFGYSVEGIGDFDHDGINDIAVGAPSMDGTGAVYLITLDTTGKAKDYVKINSTAGNFPYTLLSGSDFGKSLTMLPDVDGNGVSDLLIGADAYKTYTTTRGAGWIAMLNDTGAVIDAANISDSSAMFYSNLPGGDEFAASVDYLGTDTLGNLRVAFGTPGNDEGGTDKGAIHISLHFSYIGFSIAHRPPLIDYANLQREPDGGYFTSDSYLRFIYNEKYNDTDNKLRYNIRNEANTVVYSNSTHSVGDVYGKNLYAIDLTCSGAMLTKGYYMLEVINEKNEYSYLRFYFPINIDCRIHPR